MNDLLLPGWKRITEYDVEKHHDAEGAPVENYERIHHYPDTKCDYCWSVVRSGNRLSDIVYSMAAAYDECEKHQSMPLEYFNALIQAKLLEKLDDINKQLLAIGGLPASHDYLRGMDDGRRSALESIGLFVENMKAIA